VVAGASDGDGVGGGVRKALAGAAFVVASGWALMASASPASAAAPNARRVLVVSLQTATWSDVRAADVPHLDALLAGSAIADMTLHGANEHPSVGDGYLTIGTGARAELPDPPRPCGQAPGSAAVTCPDMARVRAHNDKLLFDARPGVLGDTLASAGVSRAVIGSSYAPYSVADRHGVVPGGIASATDVNRTVAEQVQAFRAAWQSNSVVVYEPVGSLGPGLDNELAAVLASVDLARDAVLVVSPGQRGNALETTVAALHAPGVAPSLARSAFTRRSGTVDIVDIGPTILDQLGVHRPSEMEGRPIEAGRALGSYEQRVNWLVHTNDRSLFRDRAITQVGGTFVGLQFTLAGLAILLFWRGRRIGRAARTALELMALVLLYFLPATHVAVLMPFEDWGLGPYWLYLVVASVVAACVTWLACSRRTVTALMIALGVMVGVIVVDVLTGAHLQFNAAFGYSPTIGGRYAGLGNLGYAQLAAGSVLLAGLLAHRIGGRAGVWWAGALLALAIVVDGSPFFGADVGGVLSMVPAFGVTIAMLAGWKFRWRLLALFGAAALVVLALAAAIDLSRPADSRSHLGRLLGGGGGDFGTILHRKLDANLAILGATPFAWLLPAVYLGAAYFVYRSPGPLRVVRDRIPEMDAALVGLGFVALLGTLLNDSGVAITGVMFGVVTPVLVFLSARVGVPDDVPMPAAPLPQEITA
jgi:hypothetical protein